MGLWLPLLRELEFVAPWRSDCVVVHHVETLQHRPNVRLLRQMDLPYLPIAQNIEAEAPLYLAEFLEIELRRKAGPDGLDDGLALRPVPLSLA